MLIRNSLAAILICISALTLILASAGCERVDGVSGQIQIDGSSTVAPLTQAIASKYSRISPQTRIALAISGTGGGFKRFCVGDTDLSNASRHITAAELREAQSRGVEFIEIPIALDGITFAVHRDNTWVDALTVEDIRNIFREGSTVRNWSDLREDWPNRRIDLYAPGIASGTFDFFREATFPNGGTVRLGDVTTSEDDHILVRGIAGNRDALGFFGIAYYAANQDSLRAVPIVTPTGPVAPSIETIASGEYVPYSRPLFLYINAARADREDIDAFVRYYIDNVDSVVETVGYAPIPGDLLSIVRDRFTARTTGTAWIDHTGTPIRASLRSVYAR